MAIDNSTHDLTRLALEDSLAQIAPRQVLILTDAPKKIPIPGAEYHHFDGGYISAMRALWYEVPKLIKPSHYIWIQWDSWVLDADRWEEAFLDYDYIGAPWPIDPGSFWDRYGYTEDTRVGNGGFCLRATALMRFLRTNAQLPLWLPEDDAICRKHRKALAAEGFRWAPAELATRFSFEFTAPPPEGTFGFHAGHNIPFVLSGDKLTERLRVAHRYGKCKN